MRHAALVRPACTCCGCRRGYIYRGPVWAEEELSERLCPWCIADGSVAERFDAHFTGGSALGEDVPRGVFAAVDRRTPGYFAWQEPSWFFHCGDGTAFVGPAGFAELAAHPLSMPGLRDPPRSHRPSLVCRRMPQFERPGSSFTARRNNAQGQDGCRHGRIPRDRAGDRGAPVP
ncbi:CbrC family protein [Streptomyces sp. NPDC046939]|uniref:CbrC family protein n=1 Tax=Streptomyces sp. NPDC046939 TaxID=3155376 RepID=UPI0033F62522